MVKVEMKISPTDPKHRAFAFTSSSSSEEDLDTLDAIRVAFLGTHSKMGGYASSTRLILEVIEGDSTNPERVV